MFQSLGQVSLKNGERIEAAVIVAPENDWRGDIENLLRHKGEPWNWQVARLLDGPENIEARFHLLHRDGQPFCHILTIEHQGVGLLGHVWTQPESRGQAAASHLMRAVMQSFRERNGRALFLATGYDGTAFHVYRKCGFQSVEPNSGVMAFWAASREEFEREYFAPGNAQIKALDWRHYATASALLSGAEPDAIRCAPLGILRRMLSEASFLPILQERVNDETTRAVALRKENGATVGLAAWSRDALFPGACLVDVFCHANFWHRGADLIAELSLPEGKSLIAYADGAAKREVLEACGFTPAGVLLSWIGGRDVAVLTR